MPLLYTEVFCAYSCAVSEPEGRSPAALCWRIYTAMPNIRATITTMEMEYLFIQVFYFHSGCVNRVRKGVLAIKKDLLAVKLSVLVFWAITSLD